MPKLPSPDLSWRADGSPVSARFDDIYFSTEDGLAETRHVFLNGNGLPDAWKDRPRFTICETGFGTGLNFLATWALWRDTRHPDQHLDFVSVEGFPLSGHELAQALARWPDLKELGDTLAAHYPTPHRGTHQIALPGNVTLTLLEDDALTALQGLEASVDAWFLDGFAPASNPDMWSEPLFAEMARLSAPGATLATFTVAGAVRRGLAAQGFEVAKAPGFGRKRDMLTGTLKERPETPLPKPWYRVPARPAPESALIVGAGVAGASAARALARRGVKVTLVEADAPGAGASGNPAALFMPRLAADDSAEGRFHVAAYLHMERWLSALDAADSAHVFRRTGVLQLAQSPSEAQRFEKIAARAPLPPGHMKLLDPAETKRAGEVETAFPALFFPRGGVLTPRAVLHRLLDGLDVQRAEVPRFFHEDQWKIETESGGSLSADALVLANGSGLTGFPETSWLPLEPVLGQITELPPGTLPHIAPALAAGPYLITHEDGSSLTGATYELGITPEGPRLPTTAGHEKNLSSLGRALPTFAPALAALRPDMLEGRVAFRAQVPDRVPFAGPAPDYEAYLTAYERQRHGDRFAPYPPPPCHPGLFLLGGLGARGFATALLLGEILAAEVTGAPVPLPADVGEAIHPARFIIRYLRKNAPE